MLCIACSVSAGAGLLRPYVVHDNLSLRPYQCIASHNVAYWKGRVYLGRASTSGTGPNVWAISVSDPDNLVMEKCAGSGYKAYGLKVDEDRLCVANWSTNLRIYDVTNGALTQLGEQWVYGQFGWGLDVSNGRVYLGEGSETQSRFIILDVTNPTAPSVITYREGDRMSTPAVCGSYAYYTNGYSFDVANISEETNPYLLRRIGFSHLLLASARLRGDYAYVCWSRVTDGGVMVYDISDPANPVQVGSIAGARGGRADRAGRRQSALPEAARFRVYRGAQQDVRDPHPGLDTARRGPLRQPLRDQTGNHWRRAIYAGQRHDCGGRVRPCPAGRYQRGPHRRPDGQLVREDMGSCEAGLNHSRLIRPVRRLG